MFTFQIISTFLFVYNFMLLTILNYFFRLLLVCFLFLCSLDSFNQWRRQSVSTVEASCSSQRSVSMRTARFRGALRPAQVRLLCHELSLWFKSYFPIGISCRTSRSFSFLFELCMPHSFCVHVFLCCHQCSVHIISNKS